MKRTALCLTLAFVVSSLLTSAAAADTYFGLGKGATEGAEQPIKISGGKLTERHGDGWAEGVYAGNVKVKQGDVTMTCDRLTINYEFKRAEPGREKQNARLAREAQTIQNMRSITADGNVKIVQGDRVAVAGKAVFDNKKRTIELTENPMLWHGPDRLHGRKIVFHTDTHRADISDGVSVTISSRKAIKEQEK